MNGSATKNNLIFPHSNYYALLHSYIGALLTTKTLIIIKYIIIYIQKHTKNNYCILLKAVTKINYSRQINKNKTNMKYIFSK